jgi:hypothetical protein
MKQQQRCFTNSHFELSHRVWGKLTMLPLNTKRSLLFCIHFYFFFITPPPHFFLRPHPRIEKQVQRNRSRPVFGKPVGQIKNFEIKSSKKTRGNFKIFGQNRIQKLKVNRSTKSGEAKTKEKTRKIEIRSVLHKAQTLGRYPHLLEPHPPPPPTPPALTLSDLGDFCVQTASSVYRSGIR